MIYMLDTNMLIYLIKNKPPTVAERINSLPADSRLCMSFVTYAELLKAAERSQRKEKVLAQLEQLLRIVPVEYAVDGALCRHYASQFTRLKSAGTPIGANGLWIACHALAIGARLVTHNVREFERIEGLAVEAWASER
ncbi:type II toxin-antitoxin system VapC family toxin [Methylomonas sp. EFPC3]|uniref:type II toxin-antitoxin system VapC family toxin n=1 Tax=Methylomonas sp. EFPC3 TaxID=3021710 RepID=UPI0024178DFF|nr:type II toxin-antitoxin system VapC family toxin [Methylomonas sp. EFPC3]WFP50436.1 type II toxin-antitoxin system VapC family toxin [Methylomonas sp. EFPC3]